MQIENQAAIVTGGASGLGLATGEMLASAGARVALLDIDAARVAEAAARIGGIGLQPLDAADEVLLVPVAAHLAGHAAADLVAEAAGMSGLAGIDALVEGQL